MAASEADVKLDAMYTGYVEDVNGERAIRRQAPISEQAERTVFDMLHEDGVLRRNLLSAIESDNLQTMTTPNEGQGVYSFSTRSLALSPEQLADVADDRTIEYNLHFTLAHESRHALDANAIRQANQTLSDNVVAMSGTPVPHDYTAIARAYLDRDRNFEIDAETAGVNAHVSRALAKHPGENLTLHDIYRLSPKDMEPYVDIRQTQHGPVATYKQGFATLPDGLHLDADNPTTRNTMDRLFYQEKGYEWRQGLNGVLNAINNVESQRTLDFGEGRVVEVQKDRLHPPQIDFQALGITPPENPAERVGLGHVVDSSLRKPNEHGSPDHGYFQFLQERLPNARDEDVAHLMLKAKSEGLNDPSRIQAVWTSEDGTMRIGGTRDERIAHDPRETQSMARTAGDLVEQAYDRAHQPQVEEQQKKSHCAVM
jgi:hypothetical protein